MANVTPKTELPGFTYEQYHQGCDALRNERNRAQDEAEQLRAVLRSFVEVDWYAAGHGNFHGTVSGATLDAAKVLVTELREMKSGPVRD